MNNWFLPVLSGGLAGTASFLKDRKEKEKERNQDEDSPTSDHLRTANGLWRI